MANETTNASETIAKGPPGLPRQLILALLLLVLLTGIQVYYGYLASFTIFSPYDDEGFLTSTERFFLQGRPLYTDVYSQYGPAYYLTSWFGHSLLGIPISPEAVRFVNIGCYVGVSAILGWLAFRLTGSLVALIAAQCMVFEMVNTIRWSPSHPQEMCLVLIALAVLAISLVREGRANILPFLVAGCCGGLLLGTKFNLGVFLVIAGLIALVWTCESSDRFAPILRVLKVIGAIVGFLLPLYLLRHKLAAEGGFLVASVWAALGLCLWAGGRFRGGGIRPSALGFTTLGVVLGLVVPSLFVLARGTSPGALLYGVLLQHLEREQSYSIPLQVVPWQYIVCLPLAVLAYVLLAGPLSSRLPERVRDGSLLGLKALVGFLFLRPVLVGLGNYIPFLPLVSWLILIPPSRPLPYWQWVTRLFIAFASVFETLWVYPVAGGQIGCAAMLPTLIAACCLGDAWEVFAATIRERFGEGKRGPALVVTGGVAVVVLLAVSYSVLINLAAVQLGFARNVPLGLRGAMGIHLPAEDARLYQDLTAYLKTRPEAVVTLPGSNSLLYWADKEPVSPLLTAGRWMTLLSTEEQNRVIARLQELEQGQGVIVIFNPKLVEFWTRGTSIRNEPLVKYLGEHYVQPARSFGAYVILENSKKVLNRP